MRIADAPEHAWSLAAHTILALSAWDWDGLIEARAHANSIGHIVDPTGYRNLIYDKTAAKNLELAKAIAALLRSARESHPEIFSHD